MELNTTPSIEASREERAAYVPSPDAREYDGPLDRDGEPFPSRRRRWEKSRRAATDAATGEEEAPIEEDTDAPALFDGDDLAWLDGASDMPTELRQAARLLTEFSMEAPMYPSSPDVEYAAYIGRFSFGEYARTGAGCRAMFRLIRQSLEWLEADYLACESEEMAHLRGQLEAFEQLHHSDESSG